MTYQQLLAQWTSMGNNVDGAANQQAFNQWADTQGGIQPDPAAPAGAASGSTGLLNTNVVDAANNSLLTGAAGANNNANTHQVQGTTQTGTLAGTENTQQDGTQNTTGSTSGTTTQDQTSKGTQAGSTDTASTTAGTSTTGVANDLGLSGLLRDQGQNLAGVDSNRTSFLQDTMLNGGAQLNDQIDAGIRSSLSGPGMQGVGDNARGRAAGDAAANIARNNQQARLQASQQLAGPTGLQTLTQSATPLMGSQSTSNQSTLGSQLSNLVNNNTSSTAGTNSTNSIGSAINSMTGSKSNNSTAGGSSIGVASGLTPQQTTSGGGCFVSTAYVDMGMLPASTVRRAVNSKLKHLKKYESSLQGYVVYGPFLSRCVRQISLVARLLRRPVRAILYQELRLGNDRIKSRVAASFWHACFHYGSYAFSAFKRSLTANAETVAMLNRNNLNFPNWRQS